MSLSAIGQFYPEEYGISDYEEKASDQDSFILTPSLHLWKLSTRTPYFVACHAKR
jgi:hypothetical protein